jgi:D-alanyl-D-alanine carboxypeptidase (penicillin-binding protein 5/6)
MNDRAAELGCKGTHFMNPHGMPDDNHYTTAADLRLITEEALKYPLFETISNTLSYSIPATNLSDARVLQNTNGLINPNAVMYPNYLYEPAAGIKTGHTNAAGYCLISTAEKNTVKLLCIVLGSDTSEKDDGTLDFHNFTDTIDLYEWLYNHFSIQTVVSADTPMADVAVEMGSDADRVTVHPQADLAAVLPNDTDLSLYEKKITIFSERDETPVVAPVRAGDVLGELEVSKDGQVLGTIPLVASVDVSLSHAVYLKQGLHNFFAKPVVLIALLVILAIVILYLVSYIRYQRRRRIRAQEMRRRRQQEEEYYRRQQEEALRREFERGGRRR